MKIDQFILALKLIWKFSSLRIRSRILIAPLLILTAAFFEAQNVILLKPLVIKLTDTSNLPGDKINPILIFLFVSLFTAILKSFNFYNNVAISSGIGAVLPSHLFGRLINMPYSRFNTVGSGTYIDIINVKVANIVRSIINPAFQFISSFISSIFVISYLLKSEFKLSLILIFSLTSCYLLIVFITRKRIKNLSSKITNSSNVLTNTAYESLNNLREIKLMNLQEIYFNAFEENSSNYWKFYGRSILYSSLPRYALEGLILSVIAITLLFSYQFNTSLNVLVASLASLALGAQRLLPSLQNIYDTYVSISTYKDDLIMFLQTYKSLKDKFDYKNSKLQFLNFLNNKGDLLIRMENIAYRYQDMDDKEGFKNINFDVNNNDIINISGPSGSGKTTFLDILSTLVNPLDGKINISKRLTLNEGNLSISYVSQQDFLFNQTLVNNITFKELDKLDSLDKKKLNKILQIVCLESTINSLNKGLETIIGEKGDLLSGGQKQRLAIARALFANPKLLIMDEATSKLDDELEIKILKNLSNIKDLTIVVVSHGANSLSIANRKVIIKNWNVLEQ